MFNNFIDIAWKIEIAIKDKDVMAVEPGEMVLYEWDERQKSRKTWLNCISLTEL
jgi:hypothetical protein